MKFYAHDQNFNPTIIWEEFHPKKFIYPIRPTMFYGTECQAIRSKRAKAKCHRDEDERTYKTRLGIDTLDKKKGSTY